MAWFPYSATPVPELSLLRKAPQEPDYVVDVATELDTRCSSWALWEGPVFQQFGSGIDILQLIYPGAVDNPCNIFFITYLL